MYKNNKKSSCITKCKYLLIGFLLLNQSLPGISNYSYVAQADDIKNSVNSAADNVTQLSSNNIASGTFGSCPWSIDDSGTLTISTGSFNNTNGSSPWSNYSEQIKNIIFTGKVLASSDLSRLFGYMSNLSTITGLENLDTTNANTMNSMFYKCSSLSSLDLSSWDTTNVTNMNSMFEQCSSLSSLNVSNWNTVNVSQMGLMFEQCSSLSSLNVSNWNTVNVTNMYSLFSGCTSLSNLDISNWNTTSVVNLGHMFYRCNLSQD
ncbi:BspA family leucine-rich repeat surface protein [Lactococcus lactis]|nr:BspA family leucine-rich repeat surface protein [Lactococcus lactis]